MADRTSAKYVRGSSLVRFIPHCGNGTLPSATGGVFGGVGPFDFTAAHSVISAVPIYFKVDNEAVISKTLNLSTFDEDAVTVANLVTAITTAAPSGLTASKDSTTDRLKIVASSGTYLQVYGQAAELAGFGLGIGAQIVRGDTFDSITVVEVRKDDEDVSVTDAASQETSVTIPGWVKGASGVLTDTVIDYYIRRLFNGGTIDSDGVFSWPISTTQKPNFMIEIFDKVYQEGESYEQDLVGYKKVTIRKAMGSSVGDQSHTKDFAKPVYNYTAKNYLDAAGDEMSAVTEEDLTIAEFNALDFYNV